MKTQTDLDADIRSVLRHDHTYFNPPESVKMIYPCVVYKLANIKTTAANDKTYNMHNKYELTYITKDALDLAYYDLIKAFPMCTFIRYYRASGLNHYILSLYY